MTHILGQDKPSIEEVLAHHGVKGMRWGFRKDKSPTVFDHTVQSHVDGLQHFPTDTANAVASIADNMSNAYGFKITRVEPIEKKSRMFAYVESANKGENVIHIQNSTALKADLDKCVKDGWFVQSGSHSMESLMTHEAAHSIFHSANLEGKSRKEIRNAEQPIASARDQAWKKAVDQGVKDGDAQRLKGFKGLIKEHPQYQLQRKLSGYAYNSLFLEEAEAEMFASYHWSPNPPRFVDAYVQSIHHDLGYGDIQPFSGRKA